MKILHLIQNTLHEDSNVKRLGLDVLKDIKPLTYSSCCWDFSIEEAKSLINGHIYLHETKTKPSFVGGVVVDVGSVILNEGTAVSRTERVKFIFQANIECKNQVWRGADHSMAWTSGIIEI